MLTQELKKAVMNCLLESIQNTNAHNGFCAHVRGWGDVVSHRLMHENGLRIEDFKVTQHGIKVATIYRRYASRKVNLCYKQLKPTIEWLEED